MDISATAAYSFGGDWLKEVKRIINENYDYMKATLVKALPSIEISPLEGTYLVWINLSSYIKSDQTKALIQDKCKIAVNYGEWFGGERFGNFIRVNLATRKENIIEGSSRIIKGICEMQREEKIS